MKRYTNGLMLLLTLLTAAGCATHRNASVRPAAAGPERVERQRVFFDFDRAKIRNQDRPTLDGVADRLQGDRKTMAIVEGHADQIGGDRYNDILSENRARAVRVYLRDQGADPRRITMTSKGKREPLVTGRGRKQFQQNRRVEIMMTLTGREHE